MVERSPHPPYPTPPDFVDLPGTAVDLEAAPAFDIKEKIVYGIWRSRWLLVTLIALGAAGGLIAAAAAPNSYTSGARLRLRAGKVETISLEEMLGVEIERPTSFSTTDEVFLLQDPEIYLNVVDVIGATSIVVPPDPTRHDDDDTPAHVAFLHRIQKFLFSLQKPHCTDAACMQCKQRAAEVLQARTTLVPERGSSVISVFHEGLSPELAEQTTNALVEASVERHRKEFAVSQYVGITKESLDAAYESLVAVKNDYETHRKECGFVDIVAQKANLLAEQGLLSQELGKDKAQRKGLEAEIAARRKQLAEMGPTVEQIVPEQKAANPEYTWWRDRLYDLRMQRGMVARDQTKSIDWIRTEERRFDELIREAEDNRRALEDEGRQTVVTVPEQHVQIPNPMYQQVSDRILAAQAEDERLAALIEYRQKMLEETRGELQRLTACEKTHDYMEMEIGDRRRAYQKLSEQSAELDALAGIDVQPEANLRVLQAATYPLDKDGPKRSRLVLIGLFGGTALGIGIALAVHLLDRRLRYPTTVERQLGVSLLGVVPEVRALHGLRRRRVA